MEKKPAFTLAEVLITLGIIGIVAAMTLPSLVGKYQKKVTATKLKKSFATLQEIIRLSEKDNGEMSEWDFPKNADYAANESEFFKKYFLPYMKVVGKSGYYSPSRESYQIYNINGGTAINVLYWHILPDGSSIGMFSNVPGTYCWIFIDINANKGPNTLGKDIFMTEIYRQKRLLMWPTYDYRVYLDKNTLKTAPTYGCQKGGSGQYAGGYCGQLIQQDGWEIKDYYPW